MPFLQDTDAKLTLTRVATAPVLVAEIAHATGQKLVVSPALGMEVLMVSVDGVRAGDVLAKLAIAATAKWEPVEGGYRLVPDNAARSVEASAERARRVQAIGEGVKTRLAKAPDGKDSAMGAMGVSRSIDALVPMLDVNALASLEPGDRIVFATNPTAVQRPLRGNPNPIVADLISKHNEEAKKMTGQMDEVPEALSALMAGPLGDRFKRMSQPITGAPSKIVVVASKGEMSFFGGDDALSIRLEARVYGADGKVMLEDSGTLDAGLMSRIMAFAGKKPATATAEKATPIEYSPEAKSLAAGSADPETAKEMTMGPFGPKSSVPSALRTYLMAPQRNDPLALVPGEGLAALAKARRKPLVALIPDEAFPSAFANPAPKTVEEVESGLATGPMRLVPDATFYVVKAADPATARQSRLDRSALAALLRAVQDHELPTLDELGAFAAQTPAPAENRLMQAELSFFVPSLVNPMSGLVSWPSLRLYNALSPAQKQGLQAGQQVPFADLAPAGKAALRAMVYGSGGQLMTEGAEGIADDPVSVGMKMAMGGGASSAAEEPTEVAPDGLPAGGYLQATVAPETIVRPVGKDGAADEILGTDELAMFRIMSSSPMAAQMGDDAKLPETGILGARRAWKIRAYVARTVYVAANLRDDSLPKNGSPIRLADLPADVQSQVARRAEQLKKSPLGAILSMDPSEFGDKKAKP